GVIAGNPGGPGSGSVLILSAPRGAAQVRVTELPTGTGPAPVAPRVVRLAAGHTVVVTLPPPRASGRSFAFAVVITPLAGSGPARAGPGTRLGGVARSIPPVPRPLTWVPLPPVRSARPPPLP